MKDQINTLENYAFHFKTNMNKYTSYLSTKPAFEEDTIIIWLVIFNNV